MRKAITINIPEPCHQDWKKMTPNEQGRHCAACNKTVVDFTTKTDEQIIKTFEKEGSLCGRFKGQQLNRDIVLARKVKNNYLSWAASGLFAFMTVGSQDANAQDKSKTIQVDTIKQPQVKGKIATSVLDEKVVSGTVTTVSDGLPLPGASITVKGTSRGTQTDFDGNYKLKVNISEVLVVSYVGMDNAEIIISKQSKYNVALQDNIMGEIITVGYVIRETPHTYHCNIDNSDEPYISPEEIERKKNRVKQAHLRWKAKNKRLRAEWKAKRHAIRNGEQERTSLGKFFYGIKRLFSKK